MDAEELLPKINKLSKIVNGLGVIKGANCTIKETEELDEGIMVVFEWIGASGTIQETTILVPRGPQGIQGIQGEQGKRGEQGIQGIQGVKGDTGEGFIISRIYSSVDKLKEEANPVNQGLFVAAYIDDGINIYLRDVETVENTDTGDLNGYKYILNLIEASVIRGEQGPQGEQGVAGADGFSPTITVSSNTDTEYILEITTKDKKFTTANLKGADGANSEGGTGDGILTVDNYTLLPLIADDSTLTNGKLALCLQDYEDENASYKKGFYIYDLTNDTWNIFKTSALTDSDVEEVIKMLWNNASGETNLNSVVSKDNLQEISKSNNIMLMAEINSKTKRVTLEECTTMIEELNAIIRGEA